MELARISVIKAVKRRNNGKIVIAIHKLFSFTDNSSLVCSRLESVIRILASLHCNKMNAQIPEMIKMEPTSHQNSVLMGVGWDL